jgi:hypothetical protein
VQHVSGGFQNVASGSRSEVSGGKNNAATNLQSTVGGGNGVINSAADTFLP